MRLRRHRGYILKVSAIPIDPIKHKPLNLFVLILIAAFVFFGRAVYAEPGGAPNAVEAPEVNKKLAPKLDELVKSALRIEREDEGIAFVPLGDQSFSSDTEILFVRTRGTRVEMIATGKISAEQTINGQRMLLVQIDRESIVKYPHVGDLAVAMSEPMSAASSDKKGSSNFMRPEPPPEKDETKKPGYLDLTLGLSKGKLVTTTSTNSLRYPTNGAKEPAPYQFTSLHFAYYTDYFPLGIEYDSHGGTYPTSTYSGTLVTTNSSVSELSLYYPFGKLWNCLRFAPHLGILNNSFVTDNTDESLLSSVYSGFGLGLKLNVELVDGTWKPTEGAHRWFALQRFFFEFNYFPLLSVTDGSATNPSSRGQSSGSTAMEYKLGTTLLFYFDFIPFLKRWVLEGGYSVQSYNLKFTGTPVQPSDVSLGGSAIPAGSTATEKENYFYIFFGVRLDDPLYLFLYRGKK